MEGKVRFWAMIWQGWDSTCHQKEENTSQLPKKKKKKALPYFRQPEGNWKKKVLWAVYTDLACLADYAGLNIIPRKYFC